MKNINQEELNEILQKHEMWLKNKKSGKRADLMGTDLSYVELRWVDLSYAELMGANLSNANLSDVNLKNANLKNTDLTNADLRDANLRGVDLRGANLRNADLTNADLTDIKTNIHTIGYNLACPEKGSFIGYKKANGYIIELLILENAKRSSATTYKCRCDKAKVLDIEDVYTGKKIEKTKSDYDSEFIYRVGEIITVDNFDDNRWNECGTGIHFFMNRNNALNY